MSTLKTLLLAALVALPLFAQADLPYAHVENWAQWPADYTRGAGMAGAADRDGNIWYYNRGSHPVIQFSPEGKVLQAWKEDPKLSNHAGSAHGMAVGPDGGVWLVGRETNRIYKFSPEGRVLVTIGGFSGMQGDNTAKYAFDRPAGGAHDSAGNVYVAGGYRNTRVAKYGPGGEYITHWGGKGTARDSSTGAASPSIRDNIYVADRGNNRIQVFDTDGKLLRMWDGFGTPWALDWDPQEKVLWVCDGDNGRVLKFDAQGKLLGGFSSDGKAPGQLHQVHGIAVGADGALYVAETVNQRIQKFVKKR